MQASSSTYDSYRPSQWAGLSAALLVALATVALVPFLGALKLKLIVAALGGAALLGVAFLSGRPTAVFLAGWAFALTYNRQFFVFDRVFPGYSGQGPYLVLSDVFLLLIVGLWVFDAVIGKWRTEARGMKMWLWLLPFVISALISVSMANHPAWGVFESMRLFRILLLFYIFRHRVGRVEWWACVFGLCFALFAQSAMGTAEVLTGRSGLFGILGGGSMEDAGPAELRQESFYGWRRATGTMSHPPNLACFMIMIMPVAMMLIFTARNVLMRWASLLTLVVAIAGLACTLSRWPCALAVGQLGLVIIGLVVMRQVSLRVASGLLILVAFVGTLAAVPFVDKIVDRMTRDFDRSVEFRVHENKAGLKIAGEFPIWGVGLNNYREHLLRYNPEWEWALQFEDYSVKQLHLRPLASPHNGFLLILAENGLVGLVTFTIFFLGITVAAVRSLRHTTGSARAVCFGLTVGLIGLVLQQVVDFSIWADPLLYTLALCAALLSVAPEVTREPA